MIGMFYNCVNLKEISNVKIFGSGTTIQNMFRQSGLEKISDTTFENINNSRYAFSFAPLTNIFNVNFVNTNCYSFFSDCQNLTTVKILNFSTISSTAYMFNGCYHLTDIFVPGSTSLSSISNMFKWCNNLSDASIQNIINMCLNSNNISVKNIINTNIYSPFYYSNIANTRYQNRWSELTAAG